VRIWRTGALRRPGFRSFDCVGGRAPQVTVDPDNGDSWGFFYKFELAHGSQPRQEALKKKLIDANPHHGELWAKIAKSNIRRPVRRFRCLR
jgi:hypothetical protein